MIVKFKPEEIISWYKIQKRNLPWRENNIFYNVWVSEVMLQQTKIKTVIPYYTKWIKKFKNINSVSKADDNTILKMWEGLGYYARARNFHDACQQITNKKLNVDTMSIKKFKSLRGVGEYIANAVYSISRKEQIPVIDANVKRIMSRIMMLSVTKNKNIIRIRNYLQSIIPKDLPGDFNQAMMELGETICTPRNTKCDNCPINYYCLAFKNKMVDKYPTKVPKIEKPHFNIAVGIIWKENKIIITKRKPKGLLGGLWEFPGGKVINKESLKECVYREIKEELEIEIEVGDLIQEIKHQYSHFKITLYAFHCFYKKGNFKMNNCTEIKMVSISDFKKYAFPKANHKLFPFIQKPVVN